MKKGIFGVWFKELATLIFTQTVQAFLLAIIMAIIVQALQSSSGVGSTYGAGLLAIIALTQFNKIEMLIKQIFGVHSQFGPDLNSGKDGLLAGLALGKVALGGAKKIGNNAGKIVGGAAGGIKSAVHTHQLKTERDKLLAEGENADLQAEANTIATQMGNAADEYIGYSVKGAAMAQGAQAVGGTGGGTGVSSNQIQELISAVKEQTTEIKNGKLTSGKDDAKDKLKALDDQIKESKRNTRDHLVKMGSGFAETAAAIPAGALGVATGLAHGEYGKAAAYGLTAAGIADSAVSKTISGTHNAAENVVGGTVTIVHDVKTSGQNRAAKNRAIDSSQAAKASIAINTKIRDDIKSKMASESVKAMPKEQRKEVMERRKTVNTIKNQSRAKFDAGNN